MGLTITEQILKEHLVEGELKQGQEIGIKIDQTLTQDATGTMAYLEFESMGLDSVKTELSVAYIDHNTLQSGFMNADDHQFIQSAAEKFGLYFSKPGNGICHQVHLERFSAPGRTLIGSDSHTPTAGGIGMLAMGAGGLDVAVAMGGGPYYITMPKIYKVNLSGKLSPFVSAKDVILEVLRILTVKGGVGAVIEYGGNGVKTLSVPERATITNMGAELGATTSIFPSDEITKEFLTAQNRQGSYRELSADEDAIYDKVIDVDLSSLEPMIACPHSPDNVVKVSELEKKNIAVDQVCIGSCTNSSILDLLKVAAILKGERVSDSVSLSISPGSRQVLSMLSDDGGFTDILGAGARFLECACGPCIGMGFSPKSGGVSVRTFNRNFEGRSGTKDAKVYLASPETAAAAAIFGKIVDPRNLPELLGRQNPNKRELASEMTVEIPKEFTQDDHMIIKPLPLEERKNLGTIKGPNIKGLPEAKLLGNTLKSKVALKVGDNITTDHIMPAGSKILPYRSNIPHLSQYCFEVCDTEFATRAKSLGDGIIVGGANYGQGSSREHAALVPLYLGIRAVITKSFARIHRANLINAGILPLEFANEKDYGKINMLDEVEILNLQESMESGCFVAIINGREKIELKCVLSERERSIIRAGGLLKFVGGK
ncbi:MAG: aconitate hydratase [Clostridiales bacterium]|nr:aconitate hydratase [Clostridiales bacterium]MDY6117583.1 aconitate hydratase [Anaerovoracaceae bacterium]